MRRLIKNSTHQTHNTSAAVPFPAAPNNGHIKDGCQCDGEWDWLTAKRIDATLWLQRERARVLYAVCRAQPKEPSFAKQIRAAYVRARDYCQIFQTAAAFLHDGGKKMPRGEWEQSDENEFSSFTSVKIQHSADFSTRSELLWWCFKTLTAYRK